ncbi:MAG: hypothetical protein RLZZ04_2563 [Cyanobacteriota bacterium]|jgi:hypothetical protein
MGSIQLQFAVIPFKLQNAPRTAELVYLILEALMFNCLQEA